MRITVLALSSAIVLSLAACKPAEAPVDPAATAPAPVATTPATPAADAVAMRAYGNEPFWEMTDIGDGKLSFSTPDKPDGEVFTATRSEDANGIRYVGPDVTLDITKKACSDTMSDATHPYAASMTFKGKPYTGCAAPASDVMPTEDGAPAVVPAVGSDAPVARFSANGFSPAWRAEVDGDTVKLDVPEHQRVDPGFTSIKAERSAYAKGAEFTGKDGATAFTLTLDGKTRCDKATTADGPATREFNATLRYGKTTYRGCADAVK